MRKLCAVRQIIEREQLDVFEAGLLKYLGNIGGIGLHDNVFVPTLLNMTTREQFSEWVPRALSYEWIGCYAQTEIEHGSNVRGLQTTCTFDADADEFVVHTPTVGATKWWPGALGYLCTHAVVYARLILNGKDYGVHNFLVQVRDTETHMPLRGIELGDIGAKWGTNTTDNGFVRFTDVRIPRTNMFMKFASVDSSGKYTKSGPDKGSYGTMTQVRAGIVAMSFNTLATAVTIAVRYGAVRRQEPGAEEERPVLDYISMQHRLLPLLAASYALRFTGEHMMNDYLALGKEKKAKGGAVSGPMVHALSCSLKSLCSTLTLDGIEECRRSCGGHGFLLSSGLPQLYTSYMPMFTAEGDNYLLTQQSARFLLKCLKGEAHAGPLLDFLTKPRQLRAVLSTRSSADQLLDSPAIVGAFKQRLASLVVALGDEVDLYLDSHGKQSLADALNSTLVTQYRVSRALGYLYIVVSFADAVQAAEQREGSKDIAAVLGSLFTLFALSAIEKDLAEFMSCGYIDVKQSAQIRAALLRQLAEVRKHAIPLTDAFGKSDFELNSVLGRYDGQYAQALYESGVRDVANRAQMSEGGAAIPGYEEYLKPFMRGEEARARL
eukprot:TRINITY_DN11854_c0_g1_i1.p1 TRINITY_DN11854_c0_g1~~TRINITY_DN11854_c0_g1_i1.p1  ORF type:complete len:697 (+),score=224.04 TRINITY_DN11854_c0_g1_i1:275-2092(+)